LFVGYSQQTSIKADTYDKSDEHTKKDIALFVWKMHLRNMPMPGKVFLYVTAMEPPQTQPASFSFSAPPMRVVAPAQTGPFVRLRAIATNTKILKPRCGPRQAFRSHGTRPRENTAGASVVATDPKTGMKDVDTDRLSLVNTAALSEQQRRIDDLEAMLDYGNAKQTADTGPRFR